MYFVTKVYVRNLIKLYSFLSYFIIEILAKFSFLYVFETPFFHLLVITANPF